MTKLVSILDYSQTPARGLTLEESEGGVRVRFAPAPKWTFVVSLVQTIGGALAGIAIPFALRRDLSRRGLQSNPMILTFTHRIYFFSWMAALICSAAAAHCWWMYLHGAELPGTLTASAEGLAHARFRWWRMRERHWPASEITSVEVRPVWGNLNWKRMVANLYVHRRTGRPLRYRLSSADSQLPARIGSRLAAVLGCPLVLKIPPSPQE